MLPLAIFFWKDKYSISILHKYVSLSLSLSYKKEKKILVKLDLSLYKPSAN